MLGGSAVRRRLRDSRVAGIPEHDR